MVSGNYAHDMCIVAHRKSHAHYIISMSFSDWLAAMDLLSLGKTRISIRINLDNYIYHETIGRGKLFEV